MSFLADYGLFLIKTFTVVVALLAVIVAMVSLGQRGKLIKGKLEINKLNEKYQARIKRFKAEILEKKEHKAFLKAEKESEKKQKKKKKRIFSFNFHGDIKASKTYALTEIINTLLAVATTKDEVVVRLESAGGVVHAYGLAAAQLQRIRDAKIPLTITVDKVAASGGYMMACVADKILAAPFAIIGSIGVIAQLPNFYRLMKKNDVDFEQITAGEYKRTLTMLGKNTDKDRKKFQEDIEVVHELFKEFIQMHRAEVDLKKVATGEYWQAKKALDLKLVDELSTSDAYLQAQMEDADVYEIKYLTKKKLGEKLGNMTHLCMDKVFTSMKQKQTEENLI